MCQPEKEGFPNCVLVPPMGFASSSWLAHWGFKALFLVKLLFEK